MDSRTKLWLGALAALGLACVGMALWMGWWSADLYHQQDVFHRTSGADQHSDAVYAFYDRISRNAFALQALIAPFSAGALLSALALLGALARRFDRQESRL